MRTRMNEDVTSLVNTALIRQGDKMGIRLEDGSVVCPTYFQDVGGIACCIAQLDGEEYILRCPERREWFYGKVRREVPK